MNISLPKANPRIDNFLHFILLHLSWRGVRETLEWKAVKKAWKAGETRVLASALDVLASHHQRKLDSAEIAFLQGTSDMLLSASGSKPREQHPLAQ